LQQGFIDGDLCKSSRWGSRQGTTRRKLSDFFQFFFDNQQNSFYLLQKVKIKSTLAKHGKHIICNIIDPGDYARYRTLPADASGWACTLGFSPRLPGLTTAPVE
jgi:hypothetical protein